MARRHTSPLHQPPAEKRLHRTLGVVFVVWLNTALMCWFAKITGEVYAYLSGALVLIAAGKWWADKLIILRWGYNAQPK